MSSTKCTHIIIIITDIGFTDSDFNQQQRKPVTVSWQNKGF